MKKKKEENHENHEIRRLSVRSLWLLQADRLEAASLPVPSRAYPCSRGSRTCWGRRVAGRHVRLADVAGGRVVEGPVVALLAAREGGARAESVPAARQSMVTATGSRRVLEVPGCRIPAGRAEHDVLAVPTWLGGT